MPYSSGRKNDRPTGRRAPGDSLGRCTSHWCSLDTVWSFGQLWFRDARLLWLAEFTCPSQENNRILLAVCLLLRLRYMMWGGSFSAILEWNSSLLVPFQIKRETIENRPDRNCNLDLPVPHRIRVYPGGGLP